MGTNVIDALDDFTQLPYDIQTSLIDTLNKSKDKTFSKGDRALILNNIRDVMNRISTYEKGVSQKHMPALGKLLKKFLPNDILDQVGWLLDNPWPRLPNGDNRNHVENEKQIRQERNKAARKVRNKMPIDEILICCPKIEDVGVLAKRLEKLLKMKKKMTKSLMD